MVGEFLAHLVALIFATVCVSGPPADATPIPWSAQTGWEYIGGYAWDYGFHDVEGGQVWIGWHVTEKQWIIFGTTDPPDSYFDAWHAECGGWIYGKVRRGELKPPVFGSG